MSLTSILLILMANKLFISPVNALLSINRKLAFQSRLKIRLDADISHAIRREDFPILDIDAYPNKKLVYLDSAASSQKPIQVLNKV